MEAFNHETFDAAYTEGMGPVLAACKQLPMMMPQRLVELAGPEQFGKHVKDAEAPDRALDRLIAYIKEPCPGALLLVSSTGLRANSRLVKAVSKSPVGHEERFKAPANDREAVAWLSSLAERDGLRAQGAALHELVARVGHDTSALRSGLQRASGHAGQGTVRVEDVVAVVEHAREVDVFAFTDAIGRRDHAAALRMLAAMFSRESDVDRVFALMGLLTRHIRLLSTAQRAGTQALDLPPFIARKYDEQVRTSTRSVSARPTRGSRPSTRRSRGDAGAIRGEQERHAAATLGARDLRRAPRRGTPLTLAHRGRWRTADVGAPRTLAHRGRWRIADVGASRSGGEPLAPDPPERSIPANQCEDAPSARRERLSCPVRTGVGGPAPT